MRPPLLSICIPNYNRAAFLAENLTSIGKQLKSNIQVVISDDASTEDIYPVILNFKKKFPKANLKYKRRKNNLGFDRNVLKVIELADGEYCWLLSNDDQILPGSVREILGLIRRNRPALIVVNYERFDKYLQKLTAMKMVNLKHDRLFKNADTFYFFPTPSSYFRILGVNTLTMSCDIFRRDLWLKAAAYVTPFIGHNFIHVFAIVTLIKNNPSIYFASSPKVRYLANNHRFWSNLIWKDYRHILLRHMAAIGYNQERLKELKSKLKQDEFNERLWVASQKSPLYQLFYPYIYRIRKMLNYNP